jgi:LPXTG-motif cell wall-anchored protein
MQFIVTAASAAAPRAGLWITTQVPGDLLAQSLPSAGSGQANLLVAGLVLGAVCLAIAGVLLRRKTRS